MKDLTVIWGLNEVYLMLEALWFAALVHAWQFSVKKKKKKRKKLLCLWRKIDLTGSITNVVTDTKSMALSHSAWHKKLGKCSVCQFIFFSQSGPLAIPLNPSTA